MTGAVRAEARPNPEALTAVTANVYAVPLRSPDARNDRADPAADAAACAVLLGPTYRFTTYPRTAEVPACRGAPQVRATLRFPALANTLVGALGVVAVTVTDLLAAGPVPAAVIARTVSA